MYLFEWAICAVNTKTRNRRIWWWWVDQRWNIRIYMTKIKQNIRTMRSSQRNFMCAYPMIGFDNQIHMWVCLSICIRVYKSQTGESSHSRQWRLSRQCHFHFKCERVLRIVSMWTLTNNKLHCFIENHFESLQFDKLFEHFINFDVPLLQYNTN